MRRFSWCAALVIAAACAGGSAFAAEGGWSVQVGGGSTAPTDDPALRTGSSVAVTVLNDVQPWLLVGGEVALWRGVARAGLMAIPEMSFASDASRSQSLAALVRLQAPVRVGPAPFAILEAGWTRYRFGDLRYDGRSFGLPSGVDRGEAEWGARMAAGAGMRVALPGAWPDPEASVRAVTLGLRQQRGFVEYRYALAW